MLGQRRRRWASIESTLGQRLVFAGYRGYLAGKAELYYNYYHDSSVLTWINHYIFCDASLKVPCIRITMLKLLVAYTMLQRILCDNGISRHTSTDVTVETGSQLNSSLILEVLAHD